MMKSAKKLTVKLAATIALASFATVAFAQQQFNVASTTQVYTALGYQQVAAGGLAAATPLPSIPAGVRMVQVCVEAQAVRWRDDGVAPTAAIGMPLASGTCMIYGGSPNALQFIQQVAGAVLDVSYYR
jgi:hypothetical protein